MPKTKSHSYTKKSPSKSMDRASLRTSPRVSTRASPRSSPRASPHASPKSGVRKTAVNELVSTLFDSRSQAHIFHLQTDSYAKHKALNKYYEGIVPLVDKYAETYQGIYGIIKGYVAPKKHLEGEKEILPYFKKLDKQIHSLHPKLPKDLDLENAYADILDLIHSTQYLLTQLH